jgi:hypothetical protein
MAAPLAGAAVASFCSSSLGGLEMRPNPTRTLAIVVGAVAVFGSVCLPAAQNFAGDPLAVRMPDDATAANVERIADIASRLGVPFGFEAVDALDEQVSTPFRQSPKVTRLGRETAIGRETRLGKKSRLTGLSRGRSRPIDIRGVTLRQALDAAVTADRRYEWHHIDGVVVVRPASSWRDPEHPLLRLVSEGISLFDHVNALARTERVQWTLRSDTSRIFLDRGRVVTVAQPILSVSGAVPRTFPLWPAPR